MLTTAMPIYHAGMNGRLSYQITFNDVANFVEGSTVNYGVSDLELWFEKVTSRELVKRAMEEYDSTYTLLPDNILQARSIPVKSTDPLWNWNFNTSVKFLRDILINLAKEVENWTLTSFGISELLKWKYRLRPRLIIYTLMEC